jgi:hypothetical protein
MTTPAIVNPFASLAAGTVIGNFEGGSPWRGVPNLRSITENIFQTNFESATHLAAFRTNTDNLTAILISTVLPQTSSAWNLPDTRLNIGQTWPPAAGEAAYDLQFVSAIPQYRDEAGNLTTSATRIGTAQRTVETFIGNGELVHGAPVAATKMRRTPLNFVAKGLKPNTLMYLFLDGMKTKDDEWFLSREFILFTETGRFLGWDDLPIMTDDIHRRKNMTESGLRTDHVKAAGEIVDFVVQKSPSTFVSGSFVVSAHRQRINANNELESYVTMSAVGIDNEPTLPQNKQPLSVPERYNWAYGNISEAIGTGSITLYGRTSKTVATAKMFVQPSGPRTQYTDSRGHMSFHYTVPEDSNIKTGDIQIKITDNQSGDLGEATSKATTNFRSQGSIFNDEQLLLWQRSTVTDTFTVQNTLTGFDVKFNIVDPLAQSFSLPTSYDSGVFAHSVDIFFFDCTDKEPVEVAIVGMSNGYPTQEIYTKTTLETQYLINSPSGLNPTRFVFPNPIFLEPNKEYAIRIMSNSNKHRVWTSVVGKTDIITKQKITTQPSLGVLFKSQNSSTWTADQMSDLTFKLNICKFDTSATSVVTLKQNHVNGGLPTNAFACVAGSQVVRVTHPNHAMRVDDVATYSIQSTDTNSAMFNGSFLITSVLNSDSYTINLPSAATITGSFGGENAIIVDEQYQLDAGRMTCNTFIPSDTTIEAGIKVLTNNTMSRDYMPVSLTDWFSYGVPKHILNNETSRKYTNSPESFTIQYKLTSNNQYLSPAIDLSSVGMVVMNNRTYAPSVYDIGTKIFDNDTISIATDTTSCSFVASTQTITFSQETTTDTVIPGNYVKISGSLSGANDGVFEVKSVSINSGTGYTTFGLQAISQLSVNIVNQAASEDVPVSIKKYINITAPSSAIGESTEHCHITKPTRFKNLSTGLKILFDARLPFDADIKVFLRTSTETNDLSNKQWEQLAMDDSFRSNTDFYEYSIDAEGLNEFNSFQLKITTSTPNSALVPFFKKLRCIAVA